MGGISVTVMQKTKNHITHDQPAIMAHTLSLRE